VNPIKKVLETPSTEKPELHPKQFFETIANSLAEHILSPMGEIRSSKFVRFAKQVLTIAYSVSKSRDYMTLLQEGEHPTRKTRMQLGGARKKIEHSLNYLREGEKITTKMGELHPGWLNFEYPRKALERLHTDLGHLEATTAALIPPNRRTRSESLLAPANPYQLKDPEFKVTPKSSQVMHRTVELLDVEIAKFTRGKVPPHHVDEFISDYLDALGWRRVSPANVKTIRKQFKDQKTLTPR
jgi:hypothetical protein